jgi:hypothetical protein
MQAFAFVIGIILVIFYEPIPSLVIWLFNAGIVICIGGGFMEANKNSKNR